jgi:predicted RNA-binding protein with PUA-like domain
MKSEPEVFSFADLLGAEGERTCWDGVRNYRARNLLRDELKIGDGVLFYHSNAEPSGVAGIAEVVKEGYPDPSQFDPRDPHYDAESDPDDPRWFAVDVRAVKALPKLVSLADLKTSAALADMLVTRRGMRLSVQPVSAAEWKAVCRMGGLRGDF